VEDDVAIELERFRAGGGQTLEAAVNHALRAGLAVLLD